MSDCPYGSEPKPGADPAAGLVYFSDLGFPSSIPDIPDLIIKSFTGNSVTVDAGALYDYGAELAGSPGLTTIFCRLPVTPSWKI